ncbi:MAG: HAD family phosphatase [Pseudomonadota bacterium]
MTRTVLFDLGNVVVDWEPVRLYRQVFETEAEAEHFCREVCTMEWHLAHDLGVPMADNRQALIDQYPGHAEAITAWDTRWMEMFHGYVPGVPTLMARLEERGVPLFGLSNMPAEKAGETFDAFPIIHLLRDVVVSGAEKVAKPDRRIYEITHARMAAPAPSDVLFIDDRQDNIDAAEAFGFRGHLFTGAAGLEAALERHGVL